MWSVQIRFDPSSAVFKADYFNDILSTGAMWNANLNAIVTNTLYNTHVRSCTRMCKLLLSKFHVCFYKRQYSKEKKETFWNCMTQVSRSISNWLKPWTITEKLKKSRQNIAYSWVIENVQKKFNEQYLFFVERSACQLAISCLFETGFILLWRGCINWII